MITQTTMTDTQTLQDISSGIRALNASIRKIGFVLEEIAKAQGVQPCRPYEGAKPKTSDN
jgi:hypothetical protein